MKAIRYEELKEVTVSLSATGWDVIVNTHRYVEKRRLGNIYYEKEGDYNRIYKNHLDNPGYSIIQEKHYTFEYRQTVWPSDVDYSIKFLKEKAMETAKMWASTLNKMLTFSI